MRRVAYFSLLILLVTMLDAQSFNVENDIKPSPPLRIWPRSNQSVTHGHWVQFDCNVEGGQRPQNTMITWRREGNASFPENFTIGETSLRMDRMTELYGGSYICEHKNSEGRIIQNMTVFVEVCKCNFTACSEGGCIHEDLVCDGKNDCPHLETVHVASDEAVERCNNKCWIDYKQYACSNDTTECYDQSKRCDNVRDCADGSDEEYCAPPPPCPDSLNCPLIGDRTPERKPIVPITCKEGYFDTGLGSCVRCRCFNLSQQCRRADSFYQISLSSDHYDIVPVDKSYNIRDLNEEHYTIWPHENGVNIMTNYPICDDASRHHVPYLRLPVAYHGNQLNWYKGYLSYAVRYSSSEKIDTAPVAILSGNGHTLIWNSEHPVDDGEFRQDVPIGFGNWFKVEGTEKTPVGLYDFMMVLANVTDFLIKASYGDLLHLNVVITDIIMETANSHDADGLVKSDRSTASVEKCSCPTGYTGISCQMCDSGYRRVQDGSWPAECILDEPSDKASENTPQPMTDRCRLEKDELIIKNDEFKSCISRCIEENTVWSRDMNVSRATYTPRSIPSDAKGY